jgi:hypothetical protein
MRSRDKRKNIEEANKRLEESYLKSKGLVKEENVISNFIKKVFSKIKPESEEEKPVLQKVVQNAEEIQAKVEAEAKRNVEDKNELVKFNEKLINDTNLQNTFAKFLEIYHKYDSYWHYAQAHEGAYAENIYKDELDSIKNTLFSLVKKLGLNSEILARISEYTLAKESGEFLKSRGDLYNKYNPYGKKEVSESLKYRKFLKENEDKREKISDFLYSDEIMQDTGVTNFTTCDEDDWEKVKNYIDGKGINGVTGKAVFLNRNEDVTEKEFDEYYNEWVNYIEDERNLENMNKMDRVW